MLRRYNLRTIFGFFSLSGCLSACARASAFASPKSLFPARTVATPQLRAAGGSDNLSELTSTLARLDQQWKIQQSSKKSGSRWSKLILPNDPNEDAVEENLGDQTEGPTSQDFVWILEPPSNSIPSCIIVFTGGAGLGQFPNVAYNELLSRISDTLNAVCITAPYQVGLDHFSLAKKTGETLRRALVYCEDDPSRQYPPSIPTYSLSHSLGCKLQTIYMAATGQQFDGVGFMSFNNFSFGQTISMARMFAKEIRKNTGRDQFSANPLDNEEMLNTIFSFAENIVETIGVDFSPNAQDTERLIQMKYDDLLQGKTRLFVFDEDNLDNSKEFMENCSGGPGPRPSSSGLPGGHLAPVFFKFDLDDLDLDDVPPDAMGIAREAMGGFQSASFGDENALNKLADEVSSWILGKQPSRAPSWEAAARNEPPKLAGFPTPEQ